MTQTRESDASPTSSEPPPALRRQIGVFGATVMGLGSIIGTGIFVSIGVAADVTGPAVLLAIVVAAMVAACNALSSAQLAANHPVSGGTYEYGYRWLHPALGFTAGWMFLCAKSGSAATAALGFAGYVMNAFGRGQTALLAPLALGAVVVLTALVLSGIRRSTAMNTVIVTITLVSLSCFIAAGLPAAWQAGRDNLVPFFASPAGGAATADRFFEACALMFVAYTGYGRIATLGEEVHDPRKNIPRAIGVTLLVSMALYVGVGVVGITSVGAPALAEATRQQAAPLEIVARRFPLPGVASIVAIGAVTAMLGVLLNLLLGLSRVVLAMGRRGDLPAIFARLDRSGTTPYPAVVFVGLIVFGLVFLRDVKTTWSFSAFTVLVYYALTNLAALRLEREQRLYPRFVAWAGLVACLFLAFCVERTVWLAGLGLLAVGLIWHLRNRLLRRDVHRSPPRS